MKYLFDSDAVTIFYDNSRKAHHEALHQKIGQLKAEDWLQNGQNLSRYCEIKSELSF